MSDPDVEQRSPTERAIYKVRLPWGWKWTTDYAMAFELATGVQLDDADEEQEGEDLITVMGLSAREVECVYCDEEMSDSLISDHHMDKHPGERWDPIWYYDGVTA